MNENPLLMQSMPNLPSDEQLVFADQIVQSFLEKHSSILTITVSSVDGRSLVHASRSQLSGDQLAAMASSTIALCMALHRELGTGQYQQLALDGTQGRIILLSLRCGSPPLALTVVSQHTQTLGQDLWIAHQLGSNLELALSASSCS